MRLDDCYRTLELPFGAPEEEVKRAYRDLTKVWHPDRFAHDPSLRAKAEEKLKKINEAYETIGSARGDARGSPLDARDRADRTRAVSPLTLAADAVYIDTTGLSIEAVVERVMRIVEARNCEL